MIKEAVISAASKFVASFFARYNPQSIRQVASQGRDIDSLFEKYAFDRFGDLRPHLPVIRSYISSFTDSDLTLLTAGIIRSMPIPQQTALIENSEWTATQISKVWDRLVSIAK